MASKARAMPVCLAEICFHISPFSLINLLGLIPACRISSPFGGKLIHISLVLFLSQWGKALRQFTIRVCSVGRQERPGVPRWVVLPVLARVVSVDDVEQLRNGEPSSVVIVDRSRTAQSMLNPWGTVGVVILSTAVGTSSSTSVTLIVISTISSSPPASALTVTM